MGTDDLILIRTGKLGNTSKPLLRGFTQFLLNPTYPETPNHSESSKNKNDINPKINLPKDDLYKCMRLFLCLGRLFGIVPISGLFNGNLDSLSFRSRSLAGGLSIAAIILLTLYDVIALVGFFRQKKADASEITTNLREFMFVGIGLYVYVFMHKNASKLIECFQKWRSCRTTFYKEDTNLFRSITLISGVIFTLGFIENLGSHWRVVRDTYFSLNLTTAETTRDTGRSTLAENYFLEEYPQFVGLIPFHLSIAIFFYIGDKCAVYAWNFGDIFIAVIGRAVYKRFQFHYEDFKEKLEQDPRLRYDSEAWQEAVEDHDNLLKLFDQFRKLISPLIFACILVNVYFICLNLFFFLVPSEENTVNNVYTALAFLQLLLRTFTAIFCCAKVNDYAHALEELLSKCPVSTLTKEIERASLSLKITTIGFEGLNCFTLTKPFILSVFNVIFTLEIVLLQTSMGPKPNSTG